MERPNKELSVVFVMLSSRNPCVLVEVAFGQCFPASDVKTQVHGCIGTAYLDPYLNLPINNVRMGVICIGNSFLFTHKDKSENWWPYKSSCDHLLRQIVFKNMISVTLFALIINK